MKESREKETREMATWMSHNFTAMKSYEAHHSIPSYKDIMQKNVISLLFNYSPVRKQKRPISDWLVNSAKP